MPPVGAENEAEFDILEKNFAELQDELKGRVNRFYNKKANLREM